MAVKGEKTFNSFVKGLVTEANELTFPEGASVDEDNFVLNRDGSRSRRLGIDYENLYELIPTGFTEAQLAETKQTFFKWDSPTGDSSLSIGVVRIRDKFWFVDLLANNPSGNLLNNGNSITLDGLINSDIQLASLNNKLVIVSEQLDSPHVFTYNPDTLLITVSAMRLEVRDLWGVHDGLAPDTRPGYKSVAGIRVWTAASQQWREGDQLYYGNNIYEVTGTLQGKYYTTNPGSWTMWGGYQGGGTTYYGYMGSTPPTHTSGAAYNGDFYLKFVSIINNATVTRQHKYNLRNQGWNTNIEVVGGGDAIEKTATVLGVYPSNADVWTLGKNSNPSSGNYEKFDPNILKKNSTSRYQVSRGSYIIDAFDRGSARSKVSGVADLKTDREEGKLTTITSYAQRLFYSGVKSNITNPQGRSPNYNNYIFFTKTVKEPTDMIKCYQEADPTDPGINDLVASDGGTIQIPEITRIVRIVGGQSSLLVFAENGIWEVYGDTGGFYANSFQISKISTNGVFDQNSIVQIGGNFIYWSNAGIYSLTTDANSGRFKAENISLKTIQKLYLDIPFLGKKYCKGFYDEKENRVRWLYNDTATYSETNYINKYNKELIYDLTLNAFYTHSISLTDTSPYVADYIEIPNYISSSLDTNVLVGTDEVQDSSLNDVVITTAIENNRTAQFGFLTMVGTSFTLSKYQNTKFVDWETFDSIGTNYESYLVTGYEMFGDALKRKQIPYLFFYFQKTEDGFTLDNNNLIFTKPSSCLVQAQWNWADSASNGKWGSTFQAYRLGRHYIPSGPNDTFDNGEAVIVTKNKVRGSGKTLSLYIRSEEGKDMKILGWGMPVTMSQSH